MEVGHGKQETADLQLMFILAVVYCDSGPCDDNSDYTEAVYVDDG